MAILRSADQSQLQKLLLGQLPTADAERLATEYADDSRLAELAESLAGNDDALLHLLHNHETAVVDPEGERLVERLVQRLKPALPIQPKDDTAAMNRADVTTEPSSPAATEQPQKMPERLEYYRPIKVLGQGGMGTVYLAEDTRLGREVAIKTLRPELAINPQAKERFLREARSAAKLEHDHVIPIYSVGEAADGTPFLAMPLLKGEPLDALIRRTAGPLPVATAVRLAREMASGLGAAHARGLIHRDIKPANIWLEAPTGRVKILDFGLAKAADAGSEADSETNLTASGAIVGTPAYMAPEQASGHAVDGRADLFSLGCVVYELLSGKRAFSGPNTMSILMSLANHTPPAPDKLSPQCPDALSRLVMQLLEKDPAKRPASAEAVIQALDRLDKTWPTLPASESDAGSISHDISNPVAQRTTPPGSPTLIAQTQSDRDVPSDGTILLSMVTPGRKPSIPKRRIALALAGVLLTLLAAVVYRIETDKGTVVVEINDDDVEAKLKLNGIEIRDSKSGRVFTIRKLGDLREASGDYKLADGKGLKFVVLDADGLELTTNEFKLVSGAKVRVRVTAEQNGVAATASPQALAADRRAAEWVLSISGTITINNQEQVFLNNVSELPQTAFELTGVYLNHHKKVSDAGLANFQGCQNITSLFLHATDVSDVGLANFRDCKKLSALDLSHTKLTDAGLANFRDCKNLTSLVLHHNYLSGEGLANFKDCKNLTKLNLDNTGVRDGGLAHFHHCQDLLEISLYGTAVSDSGLAQFQHCKNLTILTLSGPQVSDAGLVPFRDCKNLTILGLHDTRVSDAGLAYFKDCKNLTYLELNSTPVSDAVLVHFKDCKKLTYLGLDGTKVSDASLERLTAYLNLGHLRIHKAKVTEVGIKKLSAALPKCKIEWDGGVIEPSVSPDRKAAEYVLSVGGEIKIKENGQERTIKAGGDLPQGVFELTVVNLTKTSKVSDASLAHFQNCTNLTHLYLNELTQVTDAGLAHFQNCKSFVFLSLRGTKVSDAGLAHFQGCNKLTTLDLSYTKITDAGLAHFLDCKNLSSVGLLDCQITDAGLVQLKNCKNIGNLDLGATRVSDAGLAHLKDFEKLFSLSLRGPQVSDASLAPLKDCKHLRYLGLEDTQVTDAGLELFGDWPKLHVMLKRTKVTATGVKKLSAALPGCKIEWDGGVIEPTVSPDRRAAEWVLSIYGRVTILVNGHELKPGRVGDLPRDVFELTAAHLGSNPKVNDAALAHFQGCQNLTTLDLERNKISDAGLAHFKDCKKLAVLHLLALRGVTDEGLSNFWDCENLTSLNLDWTQATDAGLSRFRNLKNLTNLNLSNTRVTDAGLGRFKDCQNLKTLNLGITTVSDAGLANFEDCRNLMVLVLSQTQVSDAGLAHFKNFRNLYRVELGSTRVSDAGLAHLKACNNVTFLNLRDTQMTDAAVADLVGMSRLQQLNLANTRMSPLGHEKLKTAFPGLKFDWSEPNRSIAAGVLAVGGSVEISQRNEQESRPIKAAADLPRDYFQVRRVSLAGVAVPLGKLLSQFSELHFPEFDRLESVDLSGCILPSNPPSNYDFLAGIHGLRELNLADAGLNDASLAKLPKMPTLKRLVLDGNNLRDGGRGFARLSDLTQLESLELRRTNVSVTSIAELKQTLPNCKIVLDAADK